MKFFGSSVKENNLGYFGIRKCTVCDAFKDVDLVEYNISENVFFLPIKSEKRRFLVCQNCGASFEISPELWGYYKTYPYRFTKSTTDEIVQKLKGIKTSLNEKKIDLKLGDEVAKSSLDMIYENLCKQYDNPQNVEELISVYFLD